MVNNKKEMKMKSTVKLFSNGTAAVSKVYSTADSKEIHIPVKTSDLADVVGSISVFGDVTLPEPPSYEPINAGGTQLQFDSKNVQRDIFTKLIGSDISIDSGAYPCVGKLIGLESKVFHRNDTTVERYFVLVLTSNGIVKVEEDKIHSFNFIEPQVQSEIEKALKRSFAKIKPDSTFVDLKVESNKEESVEFLVSYSVPVAAWKPRYQLRKNSENWILTCHAVVDNDTDDDWRDCLISVVTGDPITFDSDIAEIRRPSRERVNVVSDKTHGPVYAAQSIPQAVECSAPAPYGGQTKSIMRSMNESQGFGSISDWQPVQEAEAEARESGDFSIFTCAEPVTILSERSAIVPLFSKNLSEVNNKLVYNENNDKNNPFRSVVFKNETGSSLGKGLCEVIIDGDPSGKCVVNSCVNDEELQLVHAKENGVKVFKEHGRWNKTQIGYSFKGCVFNSISLFKRETEYKVKNNRDEKFLFELELNSYNDLSEFEVNDEKVNVVKTESGIKLCFDLEPKSLFVLTVAESYRGSDVTLHPRSKKDFEMIFKITGSSNSDINDVINMFNTITEKRKELSIIDNRRSKTKEQFELLDKIVAKHTQPEACTRYVEYTDVYDKLAELNQNYNGLEEEISKLESEFSEKLSKLEIEVVE